MTFAVGDVHGRADLLARLQASMLEATRTSGTVGHKVVYLGDYIDRGPGSRQVLDLALAGVPGFETVMLSGNHEAMMAAYLNQPRRDNAEHWYRNGGDATLESYGIRIPAEGFLDSYRKVRDDLLHAMPRTHIAAVLENGLSFMHEDDRAIFVHAGLNPDLALDQQTPHDLLWIREPFLRSQRNWGKPVVHGHTPSEWGAIVQPNRINVDTGAYSSGELTAAVLSQDRPRFIVAANPCPWLMAIDPEGQAPQGWMGWMAACARGAGSKNVGLCMPQTSIKAAEDEFAGSGIGLKPVSVSEVAVALADIRSPLSVAKRMGHIKLCYSGPSAYDGLDEAISRARDTMQRPAPV